MSTNSRATSADADDDENGNRGAGGKLAIRRSRYRATPYQLRGRERRGWFSGIIAGAGRFISSVFRTGDDGEPETSESEGVGSEADDDVINNHQENQMESENGLLSIKNRRLECESPTFKTPSKLAIERLIQNETFTRAEYKWLTEIIQSRVVDPTYPVPVLEKFHSPELCDKAVMEAKKWVEEKRSEISSKVTQRSGSFTLNTSPYSHDLENDNGSPVDMAKSYMKTLPSLFSPNKTSGLGTPSIKTCTKNNASASSPSLPPMQDLKRKCDSAALFPDDGATRNMRQKTSLSIPVSSCCRQPDFISTEHGHPENLVTVDDGISHHITDESTPHTHLLENLPNTTMQSAKKACSSSDQNADKTNILHNGSLTEAAIVDAGDPVSSCQEDISNGNLRHGDNLFNLPLETQVQIQVVSSQTEILVPEKCQDLLSNAVHEETNLYSLSKDPKDIVEDFMSAEPISMVPENDNLTLPGATGEIIGVASSGNSRPVDAQEPPVQENHISESHSSAVTETLNDTTPTHVVAKNETILSANTTTAHGVSTVPSGSSTGSKATTNSTVMNEQSTVKDADAPKATTNSTTPIKVQSNDQPTTKSANAPIEVAANSGSTAKELHNLTAKPVRQSPRKSILNKRATLSGRSPTAVNRRASVGSSTTQSKRSVRGGKRGRGK